MSDRVIEEKKLKDEEPKERNDPAKEEEQNEEVEEPNVADDLQFDQLPVINDKNDAKKKDGKPAKKKDGEPENKKEEKHSKKGVDVKDKNEKIKPKKSDDSYADIKIKMLTDSDVEQSKEKSKNDDENKDAKKNLKDKKPIKPSDHGPVIIDGVEQKVFVLKMKSIISGIGIFALVVLILLIGGDELWTSEGPDVSYGWKYQRMKYGSVSDRFDGTRKSWLALNILCVFSLAAAICALRYDDFIMRHTKGKIKEKTLKVVSCALFALSAVLFLRHLMNLVQFRWMLERRRSLDL